MSEKSYKFVSDDGILEEQIQTLVIVDSKDENFRPLSPHVHPALFPVGNKTAIEYTLESLIRFGLRKIVLIFTRHFEPIMRYLVKTKVYIENITFMEYKNLVPCNCNSLGDVLRELNMDMTLHLRGEFLIVDGILFSSIDLTEYADRHMRRRYIDDRIVMTILFYPPESEYLKDKTGNVYPSEPPIYVYQSPYSRLAANNTSYTIPFPSNRPVDLSPKTSDSTDLDKIDEDTPFAVIDVDTCEILKVEPHKGESVSIPLRGANKKFKLKFIKNLRYTGVYLVDYRAIQLFTENFDFNNFEDFVFNIVGDEILQRAVCYETVEKGYLETMSDFAHYYRVCFNFLRKLSYPECLDFNGYFPHKSEVCIGEAARVKFTVDCEGPSSIGNGTFVGEGCKIESTIIGKNCRIGANVTIINSIIWDNVSLIGNCAIDNCILCDGVTILEGTTVLNGCLIGPKMIVGPRVVIPKKSIILSFRNEDVIGPGEIVDLGAGCNGALYHLDNFDSFLYDWGPNSKTKSKISGKPIKPQNSGKVDNSEDEFGCDFYDSIKETVIRGIKNRLHVETIITEIVAQRCSFEENQAQLIMAARDSIISFCIPSKLNESQEVMNHIKEISDLMAPFCRKFFNSDSLMKLLLGGFEDSFYNRAELRVLYSRLIMQLYYHEIITYDFLKSWLDYNNEEWDQERKDYRTENIQDFIDFLVDKMQDGDSNEEVEDGNQDSENKYVVEIEESESEGARDMDEPESKQIAENFIFSEYCTLDSSIDKSGSP